MTKRKLETIVNRVYHRIQGREWYDVTLSCGHSGKVTNKKQKKKRCLWCPVEVQP